MPLRAIALAAVVLTTVGLVFSALTARNELRARALDDHGVVALAEVTAITTDRDTDAGERIAYRLAVDGTTYAGASRHLSHAELEVARANGRVEVRYLPEDPSISAPTRAATRRTQIVATLLSGALTIGGLALLAAWVSQRRAAKRARARPARVLRRRRSTRARPKGPRAAA